MRPGCGLPEALRSGGGRKWYLCAEVDYDFERADIRDIERAGG